MESFSKFHFSKFEFNINTLDAKFYYSFDNKVFFEEVLSFKSEKFNTIEVIDVNILNNILFHLHIALGISYYKAYPKVDLILDSGYLNESQIDFWKTFYSNGLGEFLYVNKISPEKLFNFINKSDKRFSKIDYSISNRALVPIGGGKDSIVSVELLKKAGINIDLFVFGKIDILKDNTSTISGLNLLLTKRVISTTLFDLNSKGYYNGHVPITGIIAFSMQVVSYLYDYKYLVLSNEKSANYGNTKWKGLDVNHQYSKSLNFEKDFGKYVNKYISSKTKYFSLLRGMYEIKIASLFSKLGKKYYKDFSSCNNNFKIQVKSTKLKEGKFWCNNCPKCTFVFSIIRPFLTNQEVLDIFGEDLYDRKDLENLFRELLGISGIKPFECVGEAEEVLLSMSNSFKDYDINNLPYILQIFYDEIYIKTDKSLLEKLEKKFVTLDDEDIIPVELKDIIFKKVN